MLHVQNYERSLERSRMSLTRTDRPRTLHLCDRERDLLDEVFAPVYSPSTGIGLDLLGLAGGNPVASTRSFLDVGTGTGVVAAQAALAGAERVVALDGSPPSCTTGENCSGGLPSPLEAVRWPANAGPGGPHQWWPGARPPVARPWRRTRPPRAGCGC
ncbi:50S ribosomal protein L11 methyltransferase [Streptomyces sp. NPDC003032]